MQPQRVAPEALVAERVEAKDLLAPAEQLGAGVLDDLVERARAHDAVIGCAPTRPVKVIASAATNNIAAKVRAVCAVLMRNRVASEEKVTGTYLEVMAFISLRLVLTMVAKRDARSSLLIDSAHLPG